MANLSGMQNMQLAGANLSSIPSTAPSGVGTLAGIGQGIASAASALVSPYKASKAQAAKDAKATLELEQDTKLGKLANSYAKAQQASSTQGGFDLEKTQTMLLTKFLDANPELGERAIALHSASTGRKAGAQSSLQRIDMEQKEERWDSYFGSPDETPEEAAKQEALYENIKREEKILAHEAKVRADDKARRDDQREVVQKKLYDSTGKMAQWKTQSLQLDLEKDMKRMQSGDVDPVAMKAAWVAKEIEWKNQLATYGEFANDPVITAQVAGVNKMFELAGGLLDGSMQKEALETEIAVAIKTQEAIIVSGGDIPAMTKENAGARLAATNNLYSNASNLKLPIAKWVTAAVSGKPIDTTEYTPEEREAVFSNLENMVKSNDPRAKEQASGHIQQMAEHLGRNGMDYTDEQVLATIKLINIPEAFDALSNTDKEALRTILDTHVLNTAKEELTNIQRHGGVTVFQAGGMAVESGEDFGDTLSFDDIATLVPGDGGISIQVNDAYKNNATVQRKARDLRMKMELINPVLEVYANVSGFGMKDLATQIFGLQDPTAVQEVASQAVDTVAQVASTAADTVAQAAPTADTPATTFADAALEAERTDDETIARFRANVPNMKAQGYTLQQVLDYWDILGFSDSATQDSLKEKLAEAWND